MAKSYFFHKEAENDDEYEAPVCVIIDKVKNGFRVHNYTAEWVFVELAAAVKKAEELLAAKPSKPDAKVESKEKAKSIAKDKTSDKEE